MQAIKRLFRRLTAGTAVQGDLDSRHPGFTCTPGDWGRGTFVPVRYDGRRGVLVLRAVNGDTQVVDLYGCGSSRVLRSITLPARRAAHHTAARCSWGMRLAYDRLNSQSPIEE